MKYIIIIWLKNDNDQRILNTPRSISKCWDILFSFRQLFFRNCLWSNSPIMSTTLQPGTTLMIQKSKLGEYITPDKLQYPLTNIIKWSNHLTQFHSPWSWDSKMRNWYILFLSVYAKLYIPTAIKTQINFVPVSGQFGTLKLSKNQQSIIAKVCLWKGNLMLQAIHSVSAWSSVYEKRILLTKPLQASQSWHQLSVYANKILVQNCFTQM